MKTISLTLIPFLIYMASYPTLIKAPSSYVPSGTPGATAGGGSSGINGPTGPGYKGGDPNSGYKSGGPNSGYKSGDTSAGYKSGDTSAGYKSGTTPGKPAGGGAPGVAIVYFPKKPLPTSLPAECKRFAGCVNTHLAADNPKEPQYHGKCCTEFKNAVPCVCKFLMSTNTKQQRAADNVVRSCNFKNPICIKKPMPPGCREDVKHCVDMHLYRRASKPTFRSPCCQKFKTSKRCIMAFKSSTDPHLKQAAQGVIDGCQFF